MPAILTESQRDVYAAVGRALTEWNHVEAALCRFYCQCLAPGPGIYPASGFWAVVSFEAKLKMTDAIARACLDGHPRLLETWNALNNRLIGKNKNRNRVAHGSVWRTTWVNKDTGVEMTDVYLVPYFFQDDDTVPPSQLFEDFDNDPRERARLGIKELSDITDSFRAASGRLKRLTESVARLERRQSSRGPKAQ